MNNKFNKILDFERDKAKKGLERAAKIAKVTRIFIAKRKKTSANIESISGITNLAKFIFITNKGKEGPPEGPLIVRKFRKNR